MTSSYSFKFLSLFLAILILFPLRPVYSAIEMNKREFLVNLTERREARDVFERMDDGQLKFLTSIGKTKFERFRERYINAETRRGSTQTREEVETLKNQPILKKDLQHFFELGVEDLVGDPVTMRISLGANDEVNEVVLFDRENNFYRIKFTVGLSLGDLQRIAMQDEFLDEFTLQRRSLRDGALVRAGQQEVPEVSEVSEISVRREITDTFDAREGFDFGETRDVPDRRDTRDVPDQWDQWDMQDQPDERECQSELCEQYEPQEIYETQDEQECQSESCSQEEEVTEAGARTEGGGVVLIPQTPRYRRGSGLGVSTPAEIGEDGQKVNWDTVIGHYLGARNFSEWLEQYPNGSKQQYDFMRLIAWRRAMIDRIIAYRNGEFDEEWWLKKYNQIMRSRRFRDIANIPEERDLLLENARNHFNSGEHGPQPYPDDSTWIVILAASAGEIIFGSGGMSQQPPFSPPSDYQPPSSWEDFQAQQEANVQKQSSLTNEDQSWEDILGDFYGQPAEEEQGSYDMTNTLGLNQGQTQFGGLANALTQLSQTQIESELPSGNGVIGEVNRANIYGLSGMSYLGLGQGYVYHTNGAQTVQIGMEAIAAAIQSAIEEARANVAFNSTQNGPNFLMPTNSLFADNVNHPFNPRSTGFLGCFNFMVPIVQTSSFTERAIPHQFTESNRFLVEIGSSIFRHIIAGPVLFQLPDGTIVDETAFGFRREGFGESANDRSKFIITETNFESGLRELGVEEGFISTTSLALRELLQQLKQEGKISRIADFEGGFIVEVNQTQTIMKNVKGVLGNRAFPDAFPLNMRINTNSNGASNLLDQTFPNHEPPGLENVGESSIPD